MTTQTTTQEKHHKQLKTYTEKFEQQFNVELDSTGHEMTARENGGIHSEEYWVKGLINSPAEGLNFKIGGWFELDTRGDEPTVYCHLSFKMNGEDVGKDYEAFKCRYHNDKEEWGQLRWGSL